MSALFAFALVPVAVIAADIRVMNAIVCLFKSVTRRRLGPRAGSGHQRKVK